MTKSFGDPGSNELNPNHLALYNITAGGDYVEITTSDGPYRISSRPCLRVSVLFIYCLSWCIYLFPQTTVLDIRE